jgi:hypothetical protein
LIRELHNFLRGHLSDGELILRVTGDLPLGRRMRVEQHLDACEACRARCDDFESLFRQVAAYHCDEADADALEVSVLRVRLVEKLNLMPDNVPEMKVVKSEKPGRSVRAFVPVNPILATGLILAVASIACVFVWLQQARPEITSNSLLMSAEAWDRAPFIGKASEVIRQTVEVATKKRTLKRTIYRDAQGKRHAREQRLDDDESQLRLKLATADVVWDAPLSAASYHDWHDAQKVREDRIRRAAGDLLILTTTTPEGAVASQSLTVRDTDFHPVRRTVSFRDSETVEIAELDYSVLPWTPAINSLFQPGTGIGGDDLIRPQTALVPLPPRALSEEQLTEAELGARLTLDRLHADTGEQIEVVRGAHGVEVHGITDTEERKHELQAQLESLPHVTAFMSSIEELKAKSQQEGELSSVKIIAMQTRTTPVEAYYLAHGRNLESLSSLARGLLNDADTIDREGKAIDDLQQRFSQNEEISLLASDTLAELLFTHKHKLLAALESEEQLLAQAQIEAPHVRQTVSSDNRNTDLSLLAERNLALTMEMALGKGGSGRPAEMIAADLAAAMSELTLRAHEVQVVPQKITKPDKRK